MEAWFEAARSRIRGGVLVTFVLVGFFVGCEGERRGGEARPATATAAPEASEAGRASQTPGESQAAGDGALPTAEPGRSPGEATTRSDDEPAEDSPAGEVAGAGAAEAARKGRGTSTGAATAAPGNAVLAKTGEARFVGTALPLPAAVREHMIGRSWREGCPVNLEDLSLLTISHWNMSGEPDRGEMVVATRVAEDVLGAFESLFEMRFPIERMRRVAHYDGDDDRSMADNNTSGFNCRRVAGTSRWSEHSFGTAIDINPVQNPYVRGDYVAPQAGEAFLDRSRRRPGMVGPTEAAVFEEIGWRWGGRWRSAKDYQHFSESGR